jgi:hypothetical protein
MMIHETYKKIPFYIKLFLIVVFILSFGFYTNIFAIGLPPPPGGYNPGAELDPDCFPGDVDCIVSISAGTMIYPGAGISVSTGSGWDTSITDNSANWNTAFGWGDHSIAGYLTSISGLNISNLTNDSGYLTTYTETDPVYSAWDKDYADLINSPTIPTTLASLSDDSTHRLVTDTEKSTWNAKQTALVSGTNIKTINSTSLLGSGDIAIAPMAYPGAGISVSTGSGWDTSITDNSANWNTTFGWGNWASNFGTTLGTIAQGNDSRIINGQTAFGWGDHSSAGYLTSLTGALLSTGATTGATSQAQSFTNGIISPTVLGGTFTTQDLNFQTTSGVGASGADMHFLVGNNGGTEAMTILNNGNVGIGNTNPSQELSLVGDLELENTTSNDTGVIYKGADRFIHNFSHPTGATETPDGQNTFVGINAGNFTMGSTATMTDEASYNTGIGYGSLFSNTSGSNNTANGMNSLYNNTDGGYNTASGLDSLYNNTTGSNNTANGIGSLYKNTTGINNSGMGGSTLYQNVSGNYNTANGYSSLFSNYSGDYNTTDGVSALYDLGTSQTGGSFNVGTSYTIKSIGTTDFTLIGASANTVGVVFTATGSGSGSGTAYPNDTDNNTAIGYNTGRGIIYGTNNTIVGANVTGLSAGLSNNIIIADGSGNQRINVGSTGNVGIGNTNPTVPLDVTGAIRSSTGEFTSSAIDVSLKQGANTVLRGTRSTTAWSDAVDTQWLQVGNTSDNVAFSSQSGTSASRVLFATNAFNINTANNNTAPIGLFDVSNGSSKLFNILSGGNVGIGDTTPSEKLDVAGSIALNGTRIIHLPDQTNFTNSLVYGTGGANLSHTSGLDGQDNSMFGIGAGNALTTGAQNSLFGLQAGNALDVNLGNTAFGTWALRVLSGSGNNYNGAFGYKSLYNLTTGTENVGLGDHNLTGLVTGSNNTSVGAYALWGGSAYDGNTAIGHYSFYNQTNAVIGNNNTAVGNGSGISATGTEGVYLGYIAGAKDQGSGNVFVGSQSGSSSANSGAAITSSYSTGVGFKSLYALTGGTNNNALGFSALQKVTTGGNNNAFGSEALWSVLTTSNSTAMGHRALYSATGASNTAVGSISLYSMTTGANNVALGYQAGRYITGGATANTTSDYSVYVGNDTKAGADNNQNEIVIGYNTTGNGSNTTTIGTGNVLYVGGASIAGKAARFTNSAGYCDIDPLTTALVCTSDINLKKNITTLDKEDNEFSLNTDITIPTTTLEKILLLTPVNYNWKTENNTDSKHVGFIAQETEQLFPDIVMTDSQTDIKSIAYSNLIPYTIKAIQELNLKIEGLSSLDTELSMSLGSLIKRFMEDMGNNIENLYASVINANKIKTETLCVGSVCVTESEFLNMVNNTNTNTNNTNTVTDNNTDTETDPNSDEPLELEEGTPDESEPQDQNSNPDESVVDDSTEEENTDSVVVSDDSVESSNEDEVASSPIAQNEENNNINTEISE